MNNDRRLMINGLTHRGMGLVNTDFFNDIDKFGGWNPKYKYVGFCHTLTREVGFCNSPHNDEMWSIIASSDEYYLSRISQHALDKYAETIWRTYISSLAPPRGIKPRID